MNFSTNTSLSRLLNEAQSSAIVRLNGAPATPAALRQLALHIKSSILTQAAFGQWKGLNITDPDDLIDLGVEAVLGKTLLGEPHIKIVYDFSKTSRPDIVVESVRA